MPTEKKATDPRLQGTSALKDPLKKIDNVASDKRNPQDIFGVRQADRSFELSSESAKNLENDWPELLEDNYNPLVMAIGILENWSLHDLPALEAMYKELDAVMDVIVDEYYHGFNNSINAFTGIITNLTEAQQGVRDLQESVFQTKTSLRRERPVLRHLTNKTGELKRALDMLRTIKHVTKLPEEVDSFVDEKRFGKAIDQLRDAIDTVDTEDYVKIPGLHNVRLKLLEKYEGILPILINELNSHLFAQCTCSKDFLMEFQDKSSKQGSSYRFGTNSSANDHNRHLQDLGRRLSKIKLLEDDQASEMNYKDITDELDLYRRGCRGAVSAIIRALCKFPRGIFSALKAVKLQVATQLFALVEHAIRDVLKNEKSQNELLADNMAASRRQNDVSTLHNVSSSTSDTGPLSTLLQLLDIIFDKFKALLSLHDYFLENVYAETRRSDSNDNGIGNYDRSGSQLYRAEQRFDPKEQNEKEESDQNVQLLYNLKDLWNAMQNELKALVFDHLNDSSMAIVPINESDAFKSINTFENHRLFSFSQTAAWSTRIGHATASSTATHPLLVTPKPSNISFLCAPIYQFVDDTIKQYFSSLGLNQEIKKHLEGFIVNYYLPYMKEDIVQKIQSLVEGPDAFTFDPFGMDESVQKDGSVFRNAKHVMHIINDLCLPSRAVQVRAEEYSLLIELVLLRYYSLCTRMFESIVKLGSAENSLLKASISPRSSIPDSARQQSFGEVAASSLLKESFVSSGEPIDELSAEIYSFQILKKGEFLSSLLSCWKRIMKECTSDTSYDNLPRAFEDAVAQENKELSALNINDESLMILSIERLKLICGLRSSMLWLIRQINHVRKEKMRQEGLPMSMTRKHAVIMPGQRNIFARSSSIIPSAHRGSVLPATKSSAKGTVYLSDEIAQRFDALTDNFKHLADRCIILLRTELRVQCEFYLSAYFYHDFQYHTGVSDSVAYVPKSISPTSEPMIQITRVLRNFEDVVESILPQSEQLFIYAGFGKFISLAVQRSLLQQRFASSMAIEKLTKDICCIQEGYATLTVHSLEKSLNEDAMFWRLRKYCEFLLKGFNYLCNVKKEDTLFNKEEIESLLKVFAHFGDQFLEPKYIQGAEMDTIALLKSTYEKA